MTNEANSIDLSTIKVLPWKGSYLHSHGFWRGYVIAAHNGVEYKIGVDGISSYADASEEDGVFEREVKRRAVRAINAANAK